MNPLTTGLARYRNNVRLLFMHPISRRTPLLTIVRWIRWQILARSGSGSVVVPFVDETKIRVASQNPDARHYLYWGISELEDMGFVLHAVGPGELFVDIGAFVGGYTVLAAGACGAEVIAIEPDPGNRDGLMRNVALNDLGARVEVRPVAVGRAPETIRMTSGGGSTTHVLAERSDVSSFEVQLETLDSIVGDRSPAFVKMDVEGFEWQVLAGGERTFARASLLAVIIELNSIGLTYGVADAQVHERMLGWGFHTFQYEPFLRTFVSLHDEINRAGGNTLYIRDIVEAERRVRQAPSHLVHGIRL